MGSGWRRSVGARIALLRLLPTVGAVPTILLGCLIVVAGLAPVAFTYASGHVVGSVPAALRGGLSSPDGSPLMGWLVLTAGLFLLQQLTGVLLQLVSGALGARLTTTLRVRAMRATLAPEGIAHLEDPAMLDKIRLAQGVGSGEFPPRVAVAGFTQMTVQRIQGLGSAVLVGAFVWWLPFALVAAWLIVRRGLRSDFLRTVDLFVGTTSDMRRSTYFRELALLPPAGKEIRIFGLAAWVRDRFNRHWAEAMGPVWDARRASIRKVVVSVGLLVAAHAVAFVLLAHAAVGGRVDLATLAVTAGAIMGIMSLGFISNNDFLVEYGTAPIPAVLELERATLAASARGSGRRDLAGLPAREIRFEGVSFHYPGAEQLVFDHLDLTIEAGRSLAVVGLNGAGKTTLVKLLARLYEPTAGRITVDGIDLRELDPQAWRGMVGAIFQDFVRYEMTAHDNVGFGALGRAADRDAIVDAGHRAGAADIVAGLEHGWDTMLSRRFTDGTDLSGGQWQRIALARALFAVDAGARVLILDEPTANLDVRAEVEIFDRFLELTRGSTTIVISHRFSTVRRADRIVVLEHGSIVEDGTHDRLLEAGGRYADMFRLQAKRFGASQPDEVPVR